MRSDSLDEIRRVLTLIGRPVTMKELIKRTGFSYNTVRQGLYELDAVRVENSFPTQFIPGTPRVEKTIPSIGPLGEGVQVLVDLIEDSNWPERWGNARLKFGNNILALQIHRDDDPIDLADKFAQAASALASISYALMQVVGNPDWYEQLAGDEE